MKYTKFARILILMLSVLIFLSSCGEETVHINTYRLPEKIRSADGVLLQNEKIELSWSLEQSALIVKDKQTGAIWSSVPYKYLISEKEENAYVKDGLCSALQIEYINAGGDLAIATSNSDANYISVGKTGKGVVIVYYFDNIGISIPLIVSLEKDGISIALDIKGIRESENRIATVSVMPFLSSIPNNLQDGYMFIPSGSGALMYSDDTERDTRLYNEPVYGMDLSDQPVKKIKNTEQVKIPVFGVYDGNNTMLSVITEGADIAEINATAGDKQYGFSAVYASFTLRGSTTAFVADVSGGKAKIKKFSDNKVGINQAKIRYFLLSSEEKGYNGMAKAYKDYLIESKGLKTGVNTPDLMLDILGGVEVKKLFLGIPYQSLSTLTSLSEAKGIVADIYKATKADTAVTLRGYGDTGLDAGAAGGGFKPNGKLGGTKGFKELNSWCKEKGIKCFYDYQMVFVNDSGKGFSVRNAALNAGNLRAKHTGYHYVTHAKTSKSSYLTGRELIAGSADSIIKYANKIGTKGVGLSDLSAYAYSDYSSEKYFCKANTASDFEKLAKKLNKNGLEIFSHAANDFAAINSDYIFDSPEKYSDEFALDKEIPFYQMVFKGTAGMSLGVINLSANPETAYLKSVATGSSLGFTVCNSYDTDLVNSYSYISKSVYSGLKSDMVRYIKEITPVLDKVGSAAIVSYEKNGELSKTVFDNGVTVYVNFGGTDINTEKGTVKARSFICG